MMIQMKAPVEPEEQQQQQQEEEEEQQQQQKMMTMMITLMRRLSLLIQEGLRYIGYSGERDSALCQCCALDQKTTWEERRLSGSTTAERIASITPRYIPV
ncbi:Hypothetical predicted protein [Xyrichtys novacula]|uniref:Uncharacterized protein n=1 Tax=Xyrichtys novacula TaxID=13765 RepID=A0AAV1FZJ6_XYRNO|nr:Hypothetical predicted protein [Xyrichtys novacula]